MNMLECVQDDNEEIGMNVVIGARRGRILDSSWFDVQGEDEDKSISYECGDRRGRATCGGKTGR